MSLSSLILAVLPRTIFKLIFEQCSSGEEGTTVDDEICLLFVDQSQSDQGHRCKQNKICVAQLEIRPSPVKKLSVDV